MHFRLAPGVLIALFSAALLHGTAPARADLIISNLPPANDISGFGFNTIPGSAGMGFLMPAGPNYLLESVTLRLQVDGADAEVTAGLWSDTGGNPGTLLTTLDNPAYSIGSPVDYTFTPATPVTLDAGTTYWVVVARSGGTSSFAWTGSFPSITPTGIATHAGARIGSAPPPIAPNSVLASYAVNASIISTPEPGSFALFGLGALGLAAWRRRSKPAGE